MSIIGLLLGRFGLPRWAQEAIVILAALGALWAALAWHNHKVYESGIAAQKRADNAAAAVLVKRAAAATQAAQEAANRAEESYREEVARNTAAAAAHPIGPVRLCLDAHASGGHLPEAGTTHSGNEGASASARNRVPVPSGNSRLRRRAGPDISSLLGLLAIREDEVNAELREYQSRQVHP